MNTYILIFILISNSFIANTVYLFGAMSVLYIIFYFLKQYKLKVSYEK